jgi:hypothetical protein
MLRTFLLVVAAVTLLHNVASAAPVFARPLPTDNLNNPAAFMRSNIAWTVSEPDVQFNGDNFELPSTSSLWRITDIVTWSVASVLGEELGDEFSDVSLYGRRQGDQMETIATGTLNTGSSINSNANITHQRVQYANGEDYEGGFLSYFPIWMHTFSNLNWIVEGGSTWEFGVWGTGRTLDPFTSYGFWFNHMSNGSASGVPQDMSDGEYLVFNLGDPNTPAFVENPFLSGAWDKGSDMNVLIFATPFTTAVPEPGTMGLLAAGAVLLAVRFKRRRV